MDGWTAAAHRQLRKLLGKFRIVHNCVVTHHNFGLSKNNYTWFIPTTEKNKRTKNMSSESNVKVFKWVSVQSSIEKIYSAPNV